MTLLTDHEILSAILPAQILDGPKSGPQRQPILAARLQEASLIIPSSSS